MNVSIMLTCLVEALACTVVWHTLISNGMSENKAFLLVTLLMALAIWGL